MHWSTRCPAVGSVSASARSLPDFGYTVAYAGTTPDRAAETLEVMLEEIRRLRDGVDLIRIGVGKIEIGFNEAGVRRQRRDARVDAVDFRRAPNLEMEMHGRGARVRFQPV